MAATELFFDYETRSCIDLQTREIDIYARDPSTKVLMCAFAFDDGPVDLWQAHLSPMPNDLRDALEDPFVVKVAWHASFERLISRHVLGIEIPAAEFLDVMIWARYMSMSGHLADVCEILRLTPEEAKLDKDKTLVKMFSIPASMGGEETLFGITEPSFFDWNSKPVEWAQFGEYCKHDVIAERSILKKLEKFPLPQLEQRGYVLDQLVNDRGVPTDMELVRGASVVAETTKTLLAAQLKTLTGLENPNSRDQMLGWVKDRGYPFSGLAKGFVDRALAGEGDVTEEVKTALTLRKQSAKTSDSKLDVLRETVGPDGRLRYQFNFLGSARAGRWSGGGVQLHNLPRPTKEVQKKLDRALELLHTGDYNLVKNEFENPLEVVASCLRSMLRAPKGFKFVICDLGAIENRVLGWVAGCDSILDVFRKGLCPYLTFATRFYGVKYEDLERDYKAGDPTAKQMRQDSKPPVLGAGYRLGGGDETIDKDENKVYTGLLGYAKNMGVELTKENSHKAVKIFREAHPEVVRLWTRLEDAAFRTMRTGEIVGVGPVTFKAFGPKILEVMLPSGRGLHYIRPKVEKIEFMGKLKDTVTYEGLDQKKHTWGRIPTQGGKWTENCLSGNTLVYTRLGLKALRTIAKDDLLWDGTAWVSHAGLINKGVQEVGNWRGLSGTRDHEILVGNVWFELELMDATTSRGALSTGLALAPVGSSSPSQENTEKPSLFATAAKNLRLRLAKFIAGKQLDALLAHTRQEAKAIRSCEGTMLSRTPNFGRCGSIAERESSPDAITHPAQPIQTTEAEESDFISAGYSAAKSGYDMSSVCRTGTTPKPISTESTTTGIMSRETLESFPEQSTPTTRETPCTFNITVFRFLTKILEKLIRLFGLEARLDTTWIAGERQSGVWSYTGRQEVFDVLNVGPDHRFMVQTNEGPVLVHNCVQGIARDLLLNDMFLAEERGLEVVLHVHDELVALVPEDSALGIKDLRECMITAPEWAKDLPLDANGFESEIYKKE